MPIVVRDCLFLCKIPCNKSIMHLASVIKKLLFDYYVYLLRMVITNYAYRVYCHGFQNNY